MSATRNDDVIALSDVSKVYYTEQIETHALHRVTLTIHHGEFVAIVGPSGAGKSTLLSVLGLIEGVTSGTYVLGGTPVHGLSPTARARIRNRDIGFIFQSFNLIETLTVFENIELPLRYRGVKSAQRRSAVEQMITRVGLMSRRDHYPSQLSGGEQQRAAVGRALVGSPKVILADEPTGNLDSKNASVVMELLSDLHEDGTTICIVTHDERCARRAQRAVSMCDGIIEVGAPAVSLV